MNPSCARCSKTVYPMEKLSCLDKVSVPKEQDASMSEYIRASGRLVEIRECSYFLN